MGKGCHIEEKKHLKSNTDEEYMPFHINSNKLVPCENLMRTEKWKAEISACTFCASMWSDMATHFSESECNVVEAGNGIK